MINLNFALVEDWTVYGAGPRKWAAPSIRTPLYYPPRRYDWFWEINRRVMGDKEVFAVSMSNGVMVETMTGRFDTWAEAKDFCTSVEEIRMKGNPHVGH